MLPSVSVGSFSLLKNAAYTGTQVKISRDTILLNARRRLIEAEVVDLKSLCFKPKATSSCNNLKRGMNFFSRLHKPCLLLFLLRLLTVTDVLAVMALLGAASPLHNLNTLQDSK